MAVVVSEETGLISFVQRGEIRRGLDATKLRGAIFEALEVGPRKTRRQNTPKPNNEAEEIAPV